MTQYGQVVCVFGCVFHVYWQTRLASFPSEKAEGRVLRW